MAKRWSPKRRERALVMHGEGATTAAIAKDIDLPLDTVEAYINALNGAKGKKGPATKTKKLVAKRPAKTKKTAAGKRAAVKAASKGKVKKGKRVPTGPRTRKQMIQAQIAAAAERFGAGTLVRACELESDYYLRRPTGIMSLDIALQGGWPAGSMCLVTGPDGAGKDYLILRTLAEQQRLHGEDFCCFLYFTEFKLDKPFARDMCGLKVGMTDAELDRVDISRADKGDVPLTDEERARYKEKVGDIITVSGGLLAEDGFELILDAIYSNIYQVVVINSLGVMETVAKDDQESLRTFAQQSNEAILLTKFMPKMFALMNKLDDEGNRNHTLLLAANQVRSKRDMGRSRPGFRVPEKAKYQGGSGAHALRHGKAIELMVHKGHDYLDKEVKPPQKLGREVEWELLKGKLGTHDGLKGTFDFWFDGGADIMEDLVNTAASLDVIEQAGAWYTYQSVSGESVRTQGRQPLRRYLADHPEDVEALRKQCLLAADVTCIYKE